MATVLIKNISRQHVLDDEDFEWIKSNLNKPLPLSGIDYARNGEILYITIYKGSGVVLLWVKDNELTYSLRDIRGKHRIKHKGGLSDVQR